MIVISLDSVRADALTFRDAQVAPHLTELAGRGTIFENAISGSSWTLPAHAELFTGAPPSLHGVQFDDLAIDPLRATLPELLRAGGWFTFGWYTGWYLAGEYGFERGFHVYENRMTGGAHIERDYRAALRDGDRARANAVAAGRDVQSHRDVTSRNVVDRAADLLERVPDDEGMFLFVHLFDPHYDYVPPPPWDERFDTGYDGPIDGRDFYRNEAIYDPTKPKPRQVDDAGLLHIVSLYKGEIGWTDAALGDLLDLVERRRGLDRTLVVVTSDHGDEFFEHGGRGHRHTLFDELIRVPLLVVPPGGRAPGARAVVDAQVSLSDVMPTVLDYAGVEPPAGTYGRSLRPALEGARLAPKPALSSLVLYRKTEGGTGEYQIQHSLRTEDEKLVRVLGLDADGVLEPRFATWFDLEADPGERKPVSDWSDPRVRAGWERLEVELDHLRALARETPSSPRAARATSVRELFGGELEALGYAGDGDVEHRSPGLALPWPPGPPPRVAYPGDDAAATDGR